MAFPLGLFLITRIALLGFAQIELMLTPDLFVPGGEQELLQHYPALDGLCRLGLPDLRQDRSHGLL